MDTVRGMKSHVCTCMYMDTLPLSLNISPTGGSDSLLTVLGGLSCLGVLRGTAEAGEPHSTVCTDPGGTRRGVGESRELERIPSAVLPRAVTPGQGSYFIGA